MNTRKKMGLFAAVAKGIDTSLQLTQPHIAAIFLRRAAALLVSGVGASGGDGSFFRRRCKVFVKRLRLGRGAPPVSTGQNPHDFGVVRLDKSQHVARADSARRFTDRLAVDAYLTPSHDTGCQTARFEESRVPKPFVQPDGGARVRQSFLKPAKAAAKGLSGSICFSRLGLA